MKEQNAYYSELITRYFTGNASPDEIRELEAWVRMAPENRAEFSAYSETFRLIRKEQIENTVDPEQEWRSMQGKLTGRQRMLLNNWFVRVAAMLIVLLIPVFLLYQYVSLNRQTSITATQPLQECLLPDGSKIVLRQGGQLSWNGNFNEKSREVELRGEAWFEVSHNAEKPFRIAVNRTIVEVVGTTFSVNTEKSEKTTEVYLATGKVKISFADQPAKSEMLTPGQVATIRETDHEIFTRINQDPNLLAWKTGHFTFNNTPLNEALSSLSEQYNVSFRMMNPALVDCRLTATFDQQPVESVLEVIKATLDLQIRKNKETWEIDGKGCSNR